jgi:resuscitation-promoting factor RpfA
MGMKALIAFFVFLLPFSVASAQEDNPWDALAECESGGNWSESSGQYEGGLQFANSTWLANGGGQYAQHAYDASREQQIEIAQNVYDQVGWSAWPGCAARLGLSGDPGGSGGGSESPPPEPAPEPAPEQPAEEAPSPEVQAQIDEQVASGGLPPGL